MPDKNKMHTPVLLDEVLAILNPQPGESYLDVTAGYGGHAAAILARTQAADRATLVDRDPKAVEVLTAQFANDGPEILNQDFLAASQSIQAAGKRYDLILADIGMSSPHLDNQSRGFSFQLDGPLDMRMDQRQTVSAATIVNEYPEAALTDILRKYGEEYRAPHFVKAIIAHRPITSTTELASVIKKAAGGRTKIHPATKTFQALRIAVNDELQQLERALAIWIHLLNPGGRLAVISFHSLEDRIVKRSLAEVAGKTYDSQMTVLTPHPVTAQKNELVSNPRARSAKLRAAVKK